MSLSTYLLEYGRLILNLLRFFIQSQSRNDFLKRRKSVSSNQKSAVKIHQSVCNVFTFTCLFSFHSQKILEFPKVYLVFSRIHGQRGKFKQVYRFCPLKISSRNSWTKKLGQKPDRSLAWQRIPQTEGRQTRKIEESQPDVCAFNQEMAKITNHQAFQGFLQVLIGFWKKEIIS